MHSLFFVSTPLLTLATSPITLKATAATLCSPSSIHLVSSLSQSLVFRCCHLSSCTDTTTTIHIIFSIVTILLRRLILPSSSWLYRPSFLCTFIPEYTTPFFLFSLPLQHNLLLPPSSHCLLPNYPHATPVQVHPASTTLCLPSPLKPS